MNWQAALTTAAGGIILFLIYDVLSQALVPVLAALDTASHGEGGQGTFALDAVLLVRASRSDCCRSPT